MNFGRIGKILITIRKTTEISSESKVLYGARLIMTTS
jgi:hypothetical protein